MYVTSENLSLSRAFEEDDLRRTFLPSPPHLCRCHQWAIVRGIYREVSILQRMERLLGNLSRLTPNEDKMDWEAAHTTYLSHPFKAKVNYAR